MKRISLFSPVVVALTMLAVSGCVSPPRHSAYRPADEEGIASTGVDLHDYRLVMERMVTSMLRHGLATESGDRPVVALGPIYNHTPHNIEVRMIGEDIRMEVMRSGLARFSTATDFERKGGESGDLYKQLEFQNESGHVNPATAQQYGQIVGADYILFGNIYGFERRSRSKTEVNFRFNLTLTEVATGLAVWSDTKAVRKMLD